jgi:large subunit ribosomal protein L25
MEKPVIEANHRTVIGKKVGVLRRQGILPGVIYGHHMDATPISMNLKSATRVLSGTTASSIITIKLDGKDLAALVREKQRNFIRGDLLHVDFQTVSLTEKLRAKVGIVLTGLAPAVKDFNGLVVTGIDQLEVECFPQDLPERVIVDISGLAKIGDGLFVKDIKLGDAVTILDDPEEQVVHITMTKEEEEAPVAEAASIEEPEVIEKGKKEEEEEEAK